MKNKKRRPEIPYKTKIRSELQKDINSICPFCDNSDVGHFQIHHIDENPANNNYSNLILLCPTCHSKITKGEISKREVEEIKISLPKKNQIEFLTTTIDDDNCSWKNTENIPNVFYRNKAKAKSPFPILNFSFINHRKQTIVLTSIHLKIKHLYSGLSGIPQPRILKSSIKYQLPITYSDGDQKFQLNEQLEIPETQAFKFQVELFRKGETDEIYEIEGKNILTFSFIFNNKIKIDVPDIFLNCNSKNEKLKIEYLG